MFSFDLTNEPLQLNATNDTTAVVSFHLWDESDPVANLKIQIGAGTVQLISANYSCSSNITLTQGQDQVWMITLAGNGIKFYLDTVLVGIIDLKECQNFTEFELHGIKFDDKDTATSHYRTRPSMKHGKCIYLY